MVSQEDNSEDLLEDIVNNEAEVEDDEQGILADPGPL